MVLIVGRDSVGSRHRETNVVMGGGPEAGDEFLGMFAESHERGRSVWPLDHKVACRPRLSPQE